MKTIYGTSAIRLLMPQTLRDLQKIETQTIDTIDVTNHKGELKQKDKDVGPAA